MPYYIAWDLSHKPRGKIDENFTELRDYLHTNDFVCYNFLETPITQESLKLYDILVFACPDFSKISSQEILEIVNWVKEDGGGLLLLNHAGGDKGRNSNLGELSEYFGIAFESDQVLDQTNNIGLENLPIITAANFIPPHPLTNGINEICYRAGCSLIVIGSAISIVSSNETSEPFSCPLICVSEPENGRICAIGSYEMFRDNTGGGFQHDEHAQLALNIFNWLISEYRMELTQYGAEHPMPTPSIQTPSQLIKQDSSVISFSPQDLSIEQIDSSKKSFSKSELLNILNIYLNHISTLESNIEYLIKVISASESDLFEHTPTDVQDYQKEKDEKSISEQESIPFSGLPIEPPEPSKKSTKDKQSSKSISKPKIKTIDQTKKKKSPQGNKQELQVELEDLESKLKSVFNLVSHIEKKHSSGKLDDKSYNKQNKKFQKDLEQIRKRIEEIKNILG